MNGAAGKSGAKRSPARLIIAAIAFVALICAGISIALYKPTEEDRIQDRVAVLISAFEKQNIETFLAGTADTISFKMDGDEAMLSKGRQEGRLSDFYRIADHVSISPKNMTIQINGESATVSFPFSYAIRNSSMLGLGDKKLPKAIITLNKTNGKWIMTELELIIQ
ncbi:MAG: hypothetical protein ABI579_04525 [Candidatus Sumerlaeota bacterium]